MPLPLPEPLTPLLGRDADLAATLPLLDEFRLVTLTGAGGSGKTRLALELARRAHEAGRTVAWVELASLTDGSLIPQQIEAALELRSGGTRDVTDELVDALCEAGALLVLDNCEHLVADSARVAERILRGCPRTTILATSREPLGIAGEQTWLVPPLANADAVQLFDARARAVLPAFALEAHNTPAVEIICARLDGIPLAIELAAARVKVLAVWQIAERLNDAFKLLSAGSRTVPRHRTIRETIDWSFRLLSDDEQTLFRRLAVFHNGFALDAAEGICGIDDVLDVLSALVDKSLVICDRTAGKARYRLLETMRQFAAEKLEQAGETERFTERHAQWYFARIEAAEPRLFGGATEPALVEQIDDDLDNIRAVLEWAERNGAGADVEQRVVYAIHWYWFARGLFHEAERRVAHALARTEPVSQAVRGRALLAAGDSAVWRADWPAVRHFGTEAAELLRDDPDDRARGVALMHIGIGHAFAGEHETAARMFDESVAAMRRTPLRVAVALTLYWSGLGALMRGDSAAARIALEEALATGEQHGVLPGIGHPSLMLGFIALRERRLDEAVARFRRALDVFVEIGDRWGLTHVIEGTALTLLRRDDDVESGSRLLGAASAAWLQLGAKPMHHVAFEDEHDARIREAVADERTRVALASGASMSYDDVLSLTRTELDRAAAPSDSRRPAPGAAPLVVRALGPFEIERDGVPLDAAALTARARELLVFLLVHRRGATKEQIGAALWPDADPARLRNNFHVTLHRLRKALGDGEWIIVQGDRYAIARNVEFDVEQFERNPRRLELYRGDFLEGLNAGEWAERLRDRLREKAEIRD